MIARRAVLLAGLAVSAGPAQAHGTLPGGGGFYAGMAHPFLATEHLLLLIALGLLLGRHPRATWRVPLVVLAGALGIGLALGTQGIVWPATPVVILALAAGLGLLLAAAVAVPAVLLAVVALGTGLAVGGDTGVPAPASPEIVARAAPYLGVLVGVFLILLNAVALSSAVGGRPWPVALRVAGSWIAAAAVMVLALQLRRLGGGG